MAEKLMGSFVGDPGFEKSCQNCPNRSETALTSIGYSCIAVKSNRAGEISYRPQWVSDGNDGVTCSDLRRPLRERVLAGIATASQLLTSHGIHLPQ